MSTEMDMTPEEIAKRRHRLGSMKGIARQVIKKLNHALKAARKVGRVWEWRVDGIREDVNKLLVELEAEEKRMR